jgi:hypothetical protein
MQLFSSYDTSLHLPPAWPCSAACTNFPLGDYAAELAAHGARVAEGEPGPGEGEQAQPGC